MIGGGSVGNSMYGITSFGGNGSFIGKIKNDTIGQFLMKDMTREGLKFPLGYTSLNTPTGCCTLFVEKDGTRTMSTFLGAGTLIGPQEIKKEDVTNLKKLCDRIYKNPKIEFADIQNAHIHSIYLINTDKGFAKELDPETYLQMTKNIIQQSEIDI